METRQYPENSAVAIENMNPYEIVHQIGTAITNGLDQEKKLLAESLLVDTLRSGSDELRQVVRCFLHSNFSHLDVNTMASLAINKDSLGCE